jgi:hypothetical protein
MASYYVEQEFNDLIEQNAVCWMVHTRLYQRLIRMCWRDWQNGEVV